MIMKRLKIILDVKDQENGVNEYKFIHITVRKIHLIDVLDVFIFFFFVIIL